MSDNPDNFFEEAGSHFYKKLPDDQFLNCLIGQKGDEWSFYRYGYQRALEVLIDHQKSNSNGQGYLAIPTLYLYRHYLEISIKTSIIMICDHYNFCCPDFDHELGNLWGKFCVCVEKTPHKDSLDSIRADVKSLIDEIEKIDPSAFGFKYPESKGVRRPYFQEDQIISINIQTMEKLILCFDCIDTALKYETQI